jgi:hypothetical protein
VLNKGEISEKTPGCIMVMLYEWYNSSFCFYRRCAAKTPDFSRGDTAANSEK